LVQMADKRKDLGYGQLKFSPMFADDERDVTVPSQLKVGPQ